MARTYIFTQAVLTATFVSVIVFTGTIATAGDDWGPLVGPWVRHSDNPLIELADFNEGYSVQNGPQTIVRKDGMWYMTIMTSQPMVTKLALSKDGIDWQPSGHGAVLKAEMPWEGNYNLVKAVVKYNGGYRAYYFGKKSGIESIGVAYSDDLIHWKKHPEPIFRANDSRLDGLRAFPDSVIRYQGKWYLYYDIAWQYHTHVKGEHQQTGVAVSDDGVNFQDSPKTPVLRCGKKGAWDDLQTGQCRVIQLGDCFYMLYSGASTRKNSDGGKYGQAFGLARARHPEGPWEKYPDNPIFTPTGKGADWDSGLLQHACPVKVGGRWRLYYNGWSRTEETKDSVGAEYGIGVALRRP